jgi:hypothetical protein
MREEKGWKRCFGGLRPGVSVREKGESEEGRKGFAWAGVLRSFDMLPRR